METYLGDGVYMAFSSTGQLVIRTTNGDATINEISLEPTTWVNLLHVLAQYKHPDFPSSF